MHVLLVEDEPGLRGMLKTALETRGYDVADFEDAESAWEAFRKAPVDLAIIDWILPGMDGLELCRKIRAHAEGRYVAILVETGRKRSEDLDSVLASGADDYLAKPFDMATLDVRLSVAEQQADNYRKQREAEERVRRAYGDVQRQVDERTEELRESEANLRAVIENTEDLIWSVDAECRLLAANSFFVNSLRDYFGFEARIGQPLTFEKFAPQLAEEWRGYYKRALGGERFAVELASEIPPAPRIVEYRFNPIRGADGEVRGVSVIGRDITEEKRTAKRLRDRELFIKGVIDATAASLFIYDLDEERNIWANRAHRELLERLTGRDPAQLTEPEILNLVHPDDVPALLRSTRRLLKAEQASEREIREYRVGSNAMGWRWLRDTASVFRRDAEGRPRQILVAALDITELKEAEYELKRERDRAEMYLRTANVMLVALDTMGRVTLVNPKGAELLGRHKRDILGKDWFDCFLPEEGREEARSAFNAFLRGEAELPRYSKGVVRCKRGAVRIIAWHNAPLTDEKGEIIGVLGSGEDITEQVEAEAALERHLDFFQRLLETIPNPIFYKDAAKVYLGCNRAFEAFVGKPRDEIVGKTVFDLAPADLAKVYDDKDSELIRSRGTQLYEESVQYADGSTHNVIFTKATFPDPKGRVGGLVGVMVDITERKQTEAELAQSHKELRALAARLSEVDEMERRRLANELHDRVSQNLTALGINLHFIQAQLSHQVGEVAEQRLEDAIGQVEDAAERIRDVMGNLRPSILDDYGLFAALRWYTKSFSDRTEIATHLSGEGLEPRLPEETETAFFRIAQEALTNVAKHAGATEVHVSLEKTAEAVRLSIADNGVGFESDKGGRATERSGWGQRIMRERAAAVGATFRVESEAGEGTRIVVEAQR